MVLQRRDWISSVGYSSAYCRARTSRKGLSVLSRANFFWFYYPVSWLAVLALTLHIAFYDVYLISPRDVGGTFMGGMNGPLFASAWMLTTGVLLLSLLLRLPGSIPACIAAGLLPLGIGTWWLINYPDDAEQQIYSITPHEIGSTMFIGAALLALGLFLRSRLRNNRLGSRPVLIGKAIVATLIAIVFIGAPIRIAMQVSLPNCAFDKDGHQLTICLSDEDERFIVD